MLGNEFQHENLGHIWPRVFCGLKEFFDETDHLSHYSDFPK